MAEAAEKRADEARKQLKEKQDELTALAIETLDFREASPELKKNFSAAVDRERQQQREQQQQQPTRTRKRNFSR